MTLPPLPQPVICEPHDPLTASAFNKRQMLSYGAACRAAALEEAIRACDEATVGYQSNSQGRYASNLCLKAIGALKDA